MSNLVQFPTARKTTRGELLATWLDGGEIRIYDALPATPDTAITTQTLLVTFEIPDPAGSVENGVFTGDSIAAVMIAETGTAGGARIVDSTGTVVFDAAVGLSGSGTLVQLDNLSLIEGGYCTVVSFTLTER